MPSIEDASTEITALSARSAVGLMRSGELSVERYVTALLERQADTASTHAFAAIDADAIVEAARDKDRLRVRGAELPPLHGLPIAVKDSIDTRAMPTSYGIPGMCGFRPGRNAPIVDLVLDRGAILFGKTNLHEFSYGWTSDNCAFGDVVNPLDPARIAGGSSGGSAAAVACGAVPLAIAEDTLGSIRLPSSFCGVAGYRPSQGRLPEGGVFPLTTSGYDSIGLMARGVSDIEWIGQVLGGVGTAQREAMVPMTLAIAPEYFLRDANDGVQAVFDDVLYALSELGVKMVWRDLPPRVAASANVMSAIVNRELLIAAEEFLKSRACEATFESLLQCDTRTANTLRRMATGNGRPSEASYASMREEARRIEAVLDQYFESTGADALIYPPVGFVAPSRDDLDAGRLAQAVMHSASVATCGRLPSAVIPAGWSDGMPAAVELCGRRQADAGLLAAAAFIEAVIRQPMANSNAATNQGANAWKRR